MNDLTQDPAIKEQGACAAACGGAMTEMLQGLRGRLDALQGDARHKARYAARNANQVVHHYPYSAIAVAAAAGLVIGLIASRR
jgi:ElaB/YqjD/DUF883 family membrane-anchored ribosome-binding protein